MKYQKGQSGNPAGRKPGKINRSTEQLRNVFQQFLETNLETMQADFDKLEPKDRLQFIERVAKMIIPAPITLESLNDAALDALLERLKNDPGQPVGITIYPDDVNL
jgi:hypothetical protein